VQGSLVSNGNAVAQPVHAGASASGYMPFHAQESTKKNPYDYEKGVEYPLETTSELWQVPPGWIVAVHEADGRLYYREVATGRMSWVHPMAANPSNNNNYGNEMDRDGLHRRTNLMDTPGNAAKRPDSHQCCACVSLMTCLPMGLCAMFHSYKVDQAWKVGNYGDAVNHSRQAYNYACWGTVIGIMVLLIWFFRNHDFEWPDFDFDR
jgi:hypothetical protein